MCHLYELTVCVVGFKTPLARECLYYSEYKNGYGISFSNSKHRNYSLCFNDRMWLICLWALSYVSVVFVIDFGVVKNMFTSEQRWYFIATTYATSLRQIATTIELHNHFQSSFSRLKHVQKLNSGVLEPTFQQRAIQLKSEALPVINKPNYRSMSWSIIKKKHQGSL